MASSKRGRVHPHPELHPQQPLPLRRRVQQHQHVEKLLRGLPLRVQHCQVPVRHPDLLARLHHDQQRQGVCRAAEGEPEVPGPDGPDAVLRQGMDY